MPACPARRAAWPALAALLAAPVGAQDIAALLECRDAMAIAAPLADIAGAAQAAGFSCRHHQDGALASVVCSGPGALTAFGERLRDFSVAERPGGARVAAMAFAASPAAVERRVARERVAAATATTPLAAAEIVEREDGSGELLCRTAASGSGTGRIAGSLDFRGVQPVPAMRVCAAPVRDPARPICRQTVAGAAGYVLDAVPPGDYYVTAYPLSDNPQRLFLVHARARAGCAAGDAGCADQLLRVRVREGGLREGIDPATLMATLPAPLSGSAQRP